MTDAGFDDGAPRLKIKAETAEDLRVLAALLQDAVGVSADVVWLKARGRFVLMLNRFCWETKRAADRAGRPYSRVRSALDIVNVTQVQARGFTPGSADEVFSILDASAEITEDGAGTVLLTCSGNVGFRISVEALEVLLTDQTDPWEAQGLPVHPVETDVIET